MSVAPAVSVILPTFDEAGNIVRLVNALLASCDPAIEIIVVDDSSPDGTADRVRESFGADPRVKLVVRDSEPGLARSIRCGIEHARGESVVVMDSDFNHDPRTVPVMCDLLRHFDLVIGSRFVAGGGMQDVTRYYCSWAFNVAIRTLLGTRVQDSLSGFFAIRRECIARLDAEAIFFGYGDYFFRLLQEAMDARMAIVEVPVFYADRTAGESKSHFASMLGDYSLALVKYVAATGLKRRSLAPLPAREPRGRRGA